MQAVRAPTVAAGAVASQRRFLNLHEYQCKRASVPIFLMLLERRCTFLTLRCARLVDLLREAGCNVQQFEVASTPEEAAAVTKRMGVKENVVKVG